MVFPSTNSWAMIPTTAIIASRPFCMWLFDILSPWLTSSDKVLQWFPPTQILHNHRNVRNGIVHFITLSPRSFWRWLQNRAPRNFRVERHDDTNSLQYSQHRWDSMRLMYLLKDTRINLSVNGIDAALAMIEYAALVRHLYLLPWTDDAFLAWTQLWPLAFLYSASHRALLPSFEDFLTCAYW